MKGLKVWTRTVQRRCVGLVTLACPMLSLNSWGWPAEITSLLGTIWLGVSGAWEIRLLKIRNDYISTRYTWMNRPLYVQRRMWRDTGTVLRKKWGIVFAVLYYYTNTVRCFWRTWCPRNTWRYTKFENQRACYAGLPYWRSSCAITYGTNVQTAQISVQVLMTLFPRRLVLTFADILPARSPDLAVPDHFLRSYVKKQDIRNSSCLYWRPTTANSGVYSRDP